jgi:CSLREA domain-containing protein
VRKLSKLTPLLVAAQLAPPLAAADFVVTRYDDPVPGACLADDCSLREALVAANSGADLDRIVLSAGVYAVNLAGIDDDAALTGDLDVIQDVEIVGAGAGLTAIDGTGLGEAIFHTKGNSTLEATWRDLTIRNAPKTALILALGTFLVERCEIRQSGTTGIFPGISSGLFAAITLKDSTITGSTASGIQASQVTLTLENTTVAGNSQAELSASNTTLTCRHCTFSDPGDSDTELLISTGTTATFENSVVAGDCFFNSSTLTSLGGNLESPGHSCTFDDAADQEDVVDLGLGALAANGGGTRTLKPSGTSVLLGAATAAGCAAADQRGASRPGDGAGCDSGAVERVDPDPPTPLFADGFEQGDPEAWSDAVGAG